MPFGVDIDPVIFMGKKELVAYTEKVKERFITQRVDDPEKFEAIFGQYLDSFAETTVTEEPTPNPPNEGEDVPDETVPEDDDNLTDVDRKVIEWVALFEFNSIIGTRRSWGKQRKRVAERKKDEDKLDERENQRELAKLAARARARLKADEKRASKRRK